MIIPSADQSLYGKTAGDLMRDDVTILEDGTTVGTFPYVESFTGYSDDAAEQEGHYIWIRLGEEYEGKPITVTNSGNGKTKTVADRDWVIRLKDIKTTVEFKSEETTIIKLSFEGATFEEKGGA